MDVNNNADQPTKDASSQKGIRGRKRKEHLLRSGTEGQEKEKNQEEVNITPNGKVLQISVVPNTQHYRVSFTTGGELPDSLTGLFTSTFFAQRAIDAYLNLKRTNHA